jgi:hypothetical protein
MKCPFDIVSVSTDLESGFLQFLPLLSSSFGKFFPEVKIHLSVVGYATNEYLDALKPFDNVETNWYEPVAKIPLPNQGKLLRLWHASTLGSKVVMIHDLDTAPLQRNYLYDLLLLRRPNHILLVGSEVYVNTEMEGKTPMQPTTAEGNVFNDLISDFGQNWQSFVMAFQNNRYGDGKANILNSPVTNFSDETALQYMLVRKSTKKHYVKRSELRSLNPSSDWIDRSNPEFCLNKLYSAHYTEVNFLRPFSENQKFLMDVVKYVCN